MNVTFLIVLLANAGGMKVFVKDVQLINTEFTFFSFFLHFASVSVGGGRIIFLSYSGYF